MAKCMICGKECKGECCSGACRAKKSRRMVGTAHAHGVTVTEQGSIDIVACASQIKELPVCVPEPVRGRYAKGEPDYVQTIDRLLAHTIDELKAKGTWIPVWRQTAGKSIALQAPA